MSKSPSRCARQLYSALLVSVITALAALSGCVQRPSESDEPLRVYCGAGIRPPVAELVDLFRAERDVQIECDYAGSNMLLSRIKLTGKGDLYMPGDERYVQQAKDEGLLDSWETACYLVPVMLVRKSRVGLINEVSDLVRPGVRIGLGDPDACAIGKVARKILKLNSISAEAIEPNLVYSALTVDELGVQIKTGKIDAAIVWDATAHQYLDEGAIVLIPAESNIVSTVPIAVLGSSKSPELAREFQQFVVSERGKQVFDKHHYTTNRPE